MKGFRSQVLPFLLFIAACDCNTTLDPVVPLDGGHDPVDPADAEGQDPDVDFPEEVEEEPAAPTCDGDETLSIRIVDLLGADLEGTRVAVGCLGNVTEGELDAQGRVAFPGLNFSSVPVDLTVVFVGAEPVGALTILGIGGERPVPDPFILEVIAQDPPAPQTVVMRGDVVHHAENSTVVVSVQNGYDWLDPYTVSTPVGAGLPMDVFEYTSEDDVATVLGHSRITYDAPYEEGQGPTAEAAAGGIAQNTIDVTYDLADRSPLRYHMVPSDEDWMGLGGGPSRLYTGVNIYAFDARDNWTFGGFSTSWLVGREADSVGYAWAPAVLAAADRVLPTVKIYDGAGAYGVAICPRGDPGTWGPIKVHDLPPSPGLDRAVPVTMETEIQMVRPEWDNPFGGSESIHAAMIYQILEEPNGHVMPMFMGFVRWQVMPMPGVASFRWADLPWPASVDMSEVLPTIGGFGITANAFDADPFEGHAWFTSTDWFYNNLVSISMDWRFLFE